MSETSKRQEILPSARQVMRQADRRGGYMASLLMIYQETERLDDEQLATHLGLAVDRMPILALCREPRGDAPFFRQDIAEIADYTGAGVANLAMFVRAAQGLRRMRASSDRTTGYLAAARDAETSTEEP